MPGAVGAPGSPGADGKPGAVGPRGLPGPPGPSILSIDDGGSGEEKETPQEGMSKWQPGALVLKGPAGSKGDIGLPGEKGERGQKASIPFCIFHHFSFYA